MQKELFWENVERLVRAEDALARAEQIARRAQRTQKLATVGLGFTVLSAVFVGAYLFGLLLLYLIPA